MSDLKQTIEDTLGGIIDPHLDRDLVKSKAVKDITVDGDKATGENRERTEWHSVAIFQEGLVRVAEQYLRKGSTVYIEGKLQTRKWQDQSGADRYTTEVVLQGFDGTLVMLGGRGDSGGSSSGGDQGGYDNGPSGGSSGGYDSGPSGGMDDEIPF